MNIIVTRPSPAGERLTEQLKTAGYEAYHVPLIYFSAGSELPLLIGLLQQLDSDDLIFLLSKQAVYYTHAWLQQHNYPWPHNASYYAIGHTTAGTLLQLSGRKAYFPAAENSSETLLLHEGLLSITQKKALILRGNGGRQLLYKTLINRGAQVLQCECYQRHKIAYSGTELSRNWQKAGINTFIITSGEMLTYLYNLMPKQDQMTWVFKCHLIVVSKRLAKLASQLGWQHIKIAESADNDALFRALQQIS